MLPCFRHRCKQVAVGAKSDAKMVGLGLVGAATLPVHWWEEYRRACLPACLPVCVQQRVTEQEVLMPAAPFPPHENMSSYTQSPRASLRRRL